jgi:hypothetical protein
MAVSCSLSYTALDWQYNPHRVDVIGRILESRPEWNVYLARQAKDWAVYYGLQITFHKSLSSAAVEYEHCLAHAKSCHG